MTKEKIDVPVAYAEAPAATTDGSKPKFSPDEIVKMLQSLGINPNQLKRNEEDKQKEYKFWKTQPVPQFDAEIATEGAIQQPSETRQTPYPLPSTYEWCLLDLTTEKECKDVYDLLTFNYVEDDDAIFRFDYTAEFINWGVLPPRCEPAWQLGVRATESRKLVAFISGIPMTMRLRDTVVETAEINFLCVHKQLRSKRLAPVMIKEITRRINLTGIYQAVFTAGVLLPKPLTSCRYYHRNLNPMKLIDVGFSSLHYGMTLATTIKKYALPTTTATPNLRQMELRDVPQVTALLNAKLRNYALAPVFTEEDIRHWMMPRDRVVFAHVQEVDGNVVQCVSFYSLASSIIRECDYTHVNAAFMFYTVGKDAESLKVLVNDALILAKEAGFDVFNCLRMMENEGFLDELLFGKGDGTLNYYLYNYNLLGIQSSDIGLIML